MTNQNLDFVERIHHNWSNGRTDTVIRRLLSSTNCKDYSEKIKNKSLLGRFLAQSGLTNKATDVFNELYKINFKHVNESAKFWFYISSAFFEYEIQRNFEKSKYFLQKAIYLGKKFRNTRDIQLLLTSGYWRLSSIELANGNILDFKNYQDIAFNMAEDIHDSHERGIVLLSKGYSNLALGKINNSYDDFLKGLFCVGYENAPIPHYLHAELMLGLVLSQLELKKINQTLACAIDELSALSKIRKVISQGNNRIVTPYPNFKIIIPKNLTENILANDSSLSTKQKHTRERLKKFAASSGGNICIKCGCSCDLTIDHIIPQNWGGTNWEGNLRILCRTCNSQRRDYFKFMDTDGYGRLSLKTLSQSNLIYTEK